MKKAKYQFQSNLLVNQPMYLCEKHMNQQLTKTKIMIMAWVCLSNVINYKITKLIDKNKECWVCNFNKKLRSKHEK